MVPRVSDLPKSPHEAAWRVLVAELVLIPGDPIKVFNLALIKLGNVLLEKGYTKDFVFAEFRVIGAIWTELQDRISNVSIQAH